MIKAWVPALSPGLLHLLSGGCEVLLLRKNYTCPGDRRTLNRKVKHFRKRCPTRLGYLRCFFFFEKKK